MLQRETHFWDQGMLNQDIFISKSDSVKNALKKLDQTAEKTLIVVDENKKLLGALTDGDIRRYILKGDDIEKPINGIYNSNPVFIIDFDYTEAMAKELFLKFKIELIPVVDKNKNIVDLITWDKLFSGKLKNLRKYGAIDVPVVIMSGGKGTRMEPFTRVLPKSLIPVGNKTILEMIIDEFRNFGINRFIFTLNYKGSMIEAYFKSIEKNYDIQYIWEKDFLGTAGSLNLVKDIVQDTFIVSNCDVIVKANYQDGINFHRSHNASLTLLSSIQHFKIPYGVVNFKNGGEVTEIIEKPEYTNTINTGVYILEKSCLDLIPDNTVMDMPILIEKLLKSGKKVLTYPINEHDYIDIGQWDEYKKTIDKLTLI